MMAVLTLPPCPAQAQDTSRNYVKTVTMLDAGGTDSLQAVQYCNGLGWPTLSVATVGANGGMACTLKIYDALGRELRKYAPVPGNGLDYMTESAISSMGLFYQDEELVARHLFRQHLHQRQHGFRHGRFTVFRNRALLTCIRGIQLEWNKTHF